MEKIKALKDLPYAGVDRKKGEKFDAEEKHANILVLAGVAERVVAKPSTGTYSGRSMKSSESGANRGRSGKRSGYSRRDMRAEE